MEITVHNDGKGKRNSYEVGIRMKPEDGMPMVDDCSIINYDIEDLRGYGSSLEEAISNFKIGFMRLTEKISAISYIIQTADLRQIVTEVDCFRNPINSTNKKIKTVPPMPDFSIKSIEKTKRQIYIDGMLNEMRKNGADSMSIDLNFKDNGKIYSISVYLNEEGSEVEDDT